MKKLDIKKSICVGLALAVCLQGLTACGSDDAGSSRYQNDGNGVEEALNEQMAKEDAESTTEQPTTEATTEATTEERPEVDTEAMKNSDLIDLTVMDSNMVYSTVYQMMADAPSYVGKKVRMKGSYYSSYDETTKQRYYFIIIQDAAACCQQGLEFIWDDGSHVFPDEYPEDGTEAVVEGTFETYKDNPDDVYEYIHLVDASFEVTSETANQN